MSPHHIPDGKRCGLFHILSAVAHWHTHFRQHCILLLVYPSALLLLLLLWEHNGQAHACRCAVTPPAAMDCIYTQGEPLPHIGAYTRTRENKISTRESESVVVQAYHISHTHDSILPRIGRWVWCGGGWRWLKSRNPLPFSGGVGGFLPMAQPRSLAEVP